MRTKESGRIGGLRWFAAGACALLLAAVTAGGANAQTVFDTFANTFQLHGYLENQTIERSDTFIRDWHNASLRNRFDVQVSGTLARSLDMPLMPGASVEYFLDMRPGYEAAYDVDRDRFGNATTGMSGGAPGYSPFSHVDGLDLGAPWLTAFGYNPKQFQQNGPKDYGVPMPRDPHTKYLPRLEGACKHCPDTTLPLSRLRWEISSASGHDYPVREAYFDIRWFWHGQNWLRLGKQEIVYGKADFFRLQDITNNVDFAQHFNVEPFEDTRIPNWSASLQHRFGDIGPARDVALTGVWNFDLYKPVGLGQGAQPWAINFGQEVSAFSFTGDTFEHGFNVAPCNNGMGAMGTCPKFGPHEFRMPDYTFKNMGYGMKLDWEIQDPQIRFALTDYFGEGDPVFKILAPNIIATGANPLGMFTGPSLTSSALGTQMYNCLKARGVKESPWALGTVLMVTKPNSNIPACLPKGLPLWPDAHGTQGFMQTYGADGYTAVVFHKMNTLGLSGDYFDAASGLVFRVESSWSHNALVNDTTSFDWTATQDVLQWVVGADKQFFIRAINPDRTFFGSAQVFAHYLPGANSEGRTGVINRLSSYIFTAFVITHYYRDQVIPLAFAAYDTLGTDAEVGANVEWLLNDHWSAQIGSTAFFGKANKFDLTYDSPVKPGCFLNPKCQFNDNRYTEQFYGAAEQPLGAYRNVYDEIWTRVRYRF